MYAINSGEASENPPIFLEHILGDLIRKEEQDDHEGNGGGSDRSDENLKKNKRDKKRSKKNVSFKS